MQKIFYIALRRGQDVIYIYRPTEPKIGETMFINGVAWTVTGYIPWEYMK